MVSIKRKNKMSLQAIKKLINNEILDCEEAIREVNEDPECLDEKYIEYKIEETCNYKLIIQAYLNVITLINKYDYQQRKNKKKLISTKNK
jgi:hypothetical protein